MRLILIPVADRPECARALKVAFDLAGRLGANVVGCHIRPHQSSHVRMRVLSESYGDWSSAMRGRDAQKMGKAARALFNRLAASFRFRPGTRARADGAPVAIWQQRVGSPDKIIPIVGPMSDLIVVSRPSSRSEVAQLFMMEALLNSCRPVLILPQKKIPKIGSHVAIAWNQSAEVSRAVAACMSVLKQATRVTILVAGPEFEAKPKSSHLRPYLAHHGVRAEIVKSAGKNLEKELVTGFRRSGADVMLMGAYSRHRLRERIFGGFTDYMLRDSDIPVLMYHG